MGLAIIFFEFLCYFLFILVVYHSLKTHRKYSTLIFFIPVFTLKFIMEELGVAVFQGFYYPDYQVYILDVPLGIILGWCSVVYVSIYLAKKLLTPKFSNPKLSMFKLSVISAFIGLVIDLFLEPLSRIWNFWLWNQSGFYFDTPPGNFIAWFLIIFLYTTLYTFITQKMRSDRVKFLLMLISLVPQVIIITATLTFWRYVIKG